MTREDWLTRATDRLRPRFAALGQPIPDAVRVAVGFPSRGAMAVRKRRLGECWAPAASVDGVAQLFVSPVLATPLDVLGVLMHELAHAATPGAGHRGPFTRLIRGLGLAGKPTATEPGPELAAELVALARAIGPLPHAALNVRSRPRQTTRMRKLTCSRCGFIARAALRPLAAYGAPEHCGRKMELDS